MTLNQTWKNCLRMWGWIDKVWTPEMDVGKLKKEWLDKHKPGVVLNSNCFFCDYVDKLGIRDEFEFCECCPGKLVNKRFNCFIPAYYYFSRPKKFYQKLLHLDTKRRQ